MADEVRHVTGYLIPFSTFLAQRGMSGLAVPSVSLSGFINVKEIEAARTLLKQLGESWRAFRDKGQGTAPVVKHVARIEQLVERCRHILKCVKNSKDTEAIHAILKEHSVWLDGRLSSNSKHVAKVARMTLSLIAFNLGKLLTGTRQEDEPVAPITASSSAKARLPDEDGEPRADGDAKRQRNASRRIEE